MLAAMPFEEACDYVKSALEIQGKPYAPVISNPMDLKFKQEKIQRYFEFNK
jgi:hypothetical protein